MAAFSFEGTAVAIARKLNPALSALLLTIGGLTAAPAAHALNFVFTDNGSTPMSAV